MIINDLSHTNHDHVLTGTKKPYRRRGRREDGKLNDADEDENMLVKLTIPQINS